jgi:hypothetical protein
MNKRRMYSEEEVENILIEYSRSEYARNSRPTRFFIEYRRKEKKYPIEEEKFNDLEDMTWDNGEFYK